MAKILIEWEEDLKILLDFMSEHELGTSTPFSVVGYLYVRT